MNKIVKIILWAILGGLVLLGIVTINAQLDNKQKADAVKLRFSEIKLPSYLKVESSTWSAAFLPDSKDHLQNVYIANAYGEIAYKDAKTAVESAGYEITNSDPYKKSSGASDYFKAFGSFDAIKSGGLYLKVFVSEKDSRIKVDIRAEAVR